MNIYLDMDDVLCDSAGAYTDLLAREFGTKIDFEDIFSFNLQHSFGLDDEQNSHLFARAHEPEFVLNLDPIDGMASVLREWGREGHTISIVTGRHTSAWHDSLQWLKNHGVVHHSFIMVDKYGWEATDHRRAITLSEMSQIDFDIGVEDSPKMAAYLANQMNLEVLLFDRPWNRRHTLSTRERRCLDWKEIDQEVKRAAKNGG